MNGRRAGPLGWTDSHCHVHDDADRDEEVARALEAGVDRLVCVGTGADSSNAAVAFAKEMAGRPGAPPLYATVGLHPHEASLGADCVAPILRRHAAAPGPGGHPPGSVVAVGECGLDYYYEHSPRDAQQEAFAAQVGLAKELGIALVVHTRDAWDDTLAILAESGPPDQLVIHCFTGGTDEARRCLELGAFVSFSGIVTFKNATPVQEAACFCPGDRLLVETDSPYLAPVPFRGRPNEPAHVALVGEAIAALRGVGAGEIAELTSENARRVFSLSR